MSTMRFAETLDRWRLDAFAWRAERSWPWQLGVAFLMAGLTGLAAQVRIPLPMTPVPITGQTFAVLLAGVLLGSRWGAISQVQYVGLGALGVPWFAGMAAVVPMGPTSGYLLGFIPAAALVGWASTRFGAARRFVPLVGVMLAGVLVIYLAGAAVFALHMGTGLRDTIMLAVAPFVIGDIIKAVGAAAVAAALLK